MLRIQEYRFHLKQALLIALLLFAPGGMQILAAQPQPKSPQMQPAGKLVDVNSADAQTLDTLPGIGPALANRIIEGRPYRGIADLEKVKGLGRTKVDAMKGLITFGPATTTGKGVGMQAPAGPKNTNSVGQPTAAKPAGGAKAKKLAPGQTLNINKASVAELERLPGIGPAKAQSIAAYRTQNGPFKAIEEIQNVKGIKAAAFGKIKQYIRVAD